MSMKKERVDQFINELHSLLVNWNAQIQGADVHIEMIHEGSRAIINIDRAYPVYDEGGKEHEN